MSKIGNPILTVYDRVKASLSRFKEGEEINAWGMAREVNCEGLAANQALDQLVEEGYALRNGNYYRPVTIKPVAIELDDKDRALCLNSLMTLGTIPHSVAKKLREKANKKS